MASLVMVGISSSDTQLRTNNDVEGWHYRLNRRARLSHLPFYVLVRLLWEESQVTNAALHSSRELVFTSSRPVKKRSIHVVIS